MQACIYALEDALTVSLFDDSWLEICTQQRACGNRLAGLCGRPCPLISIMDSSWQVVVTGILDRCNHAFMTRGFVKTPSMSTFLEGQHRLAYMQRDVGPMLPADDL